MRLNNLASSVISDSYQTDGIANPSDLALDSQILRKDQSEKDGKLIIMLPGKLAGKVTAVELINPNTGQILAKGRYSGIGNEHRLQFRFDKAGELYPRPNEIRVRYA